MDHYTAKRLTQLTRETSDARETLRNPEARSDLAAINFRVLLVYFRRVHFARVLNKYSFALAMSVSEIIQVTRAGNSRYGFFARFKIKCPSSAHSCPRPPFLNGRKEGSMREKARCCSAHRCLRRPFGSRR